MQISCPEGYRPQFYADRTYEFVPIADPTPVVQPEDSTSAPSVVNTIVEETPLNEVKEQKVVASEELPCPKTSSPCKESKLEEEADRATCFEDVKPTSMLPQSTMEDTDLLTTDGDKDDCSSVTSDAVSISSEADFPALGASSSKKEFSVRHHERLPLFVTLKKLRVKADCSADSEEVAIIPAKTNVYLRGTLADYSTEGICEWFDRRLPTLNTIEWIQGNAITGAELAACSNRKEMAQLLKLNFSDAKMAYKELRSSLRYGEFVFATENGMSTGWMSMKKKGERTVKRIFGNAKPSVLISNLFCHFKYETMKFNAAGGDYNTFGNISDNDLKSTTFFSMVEDYRWEHGKYPPMQYLEQRLVEFVQSAGIDACGAIWEGEWQESRQNGAENRSVWITRRNKKPFRALRAGFCIPDTYCLLEFKSNKAAEKFMKMDWKAQHKCPLKHINSQLEETYGNLQAVVF